MPLRSAGRHYHSSNVSPCLLHQREIARLNPYYISSQEGDQISSLYTSQSQQQCRLGPKPFTITLAMSIPHHSLGAWPIRDSLRLITGLLIHNKIMLFHQPIHTFLINNDPVNITEISPYSPVTPKRMVSLDLTYTNNKPSFRSTTFSDLRLLIPELLCFF